MSNKKKNATNTKIVIDDSELYPHVHEELQVDGMIEIEGVIQSNLTIQEIIQDIREVLNDIWETVPREKLFDELMELQSIFNKSNFNSEKMYALVREIVVQKFPLNKYYILVKEFQIE